MRNLHSLAAVLGVVGTIGVMAPTMAQQSSPPTAPGAAAAKSTAPPEIVSHSSAANAANNGPTGSLQKVNDGWRASSLVGATVYNDQGTSVGTVNDLIVGDNGQISNAIISIGGFLGIGNKLVSVPFDQIKFVESATNRVASDTNPPGTTAPAGNASSTSASANPPVVSGTTPPRTCYSIVLPNATKASLTKMPDFNYNT